MFYLILILYAPLVLKGLSSLTLLERLFKFLPRAIGRVEYYVSPLRDTLISYAIGVYGIVHLARHGYDPKALILILLAVLSQINRWHRVRFRRALCPWVLRFDSVEPNSFFRIYHRGLGSFYDQIPSAVKGVNYSYLDYRRDDTSRKTVWPLFWGVFDTATLAKLAILAMKKLDGEEGVNAFDAFARIWGARFLARAHCKLHTLGVESCPPLQGKVLLVFNHKSYLDFALNFFALGNLRNNGRHLRPRFIAAKDHFIDNPLIYSWMGLGKCIEKAGMIFINRSKGKGWLAMREAAEKLAEADVEVAVYPQGTRAWGLKDEKGERIDAGYYTTFSKKTVGDPKGHLKAGTAQLILDTALRLREKKQGPLKILFVGIDGTATAGPKGSFKIRTESVITFHIGELWTVLLPDEIPLENPEGSPPSNEAQENYVDEVEAIHSHLDRLMEKSIGRHKTLIERVLKDPRLPRETLSTVKSYLQRADETENILPFVVLDRLYALTANQWEKFLHQFAQRVVSDAKRGEWEELIREVSAELVKE